MGSSRDSRISIFQERFAAVLKANGAAGPFWNELIPQSSETHPAVKHMAVAIASLQENLEKVHLGDNNDGGPQPSMSLEQCNLAIQELIASVHKTTPNEVMLTTCILLIWFELLRANPRASSKYLDLGIGMLQKPKADILHLLTNAKSSRVRWTSCRRIPNIGGGLFQDHSNRTIQRLGNEQVESC